MSCVAHCLSVCLSHYLCLVVSVSKRRLRKGLRLGVANTNRLGLGLGKKYGLGLGFEVCSMWLLMFMHM